MAMRILVTNDDGIQSEGLRTLAVWAKKLGDVTVCAPKKQQSAKSHAICIHSPIEVCKYEFGENITAYSVDSTPVDCVRFATIGLQQEYDLILSGINNGYNLGEDILYSGTVANIFEARLRNVRGIAFSTEHDKFLSDACYLDLVYDFITRNKLFDYNTIYNVNIPDIPNGKILLTRQGGAYFTDEFVKLDDTHYDQRGYSVYEFGTNLELDTDATMNGYVSVTPLSVIRDDREAFNKLIKIITKTK